MLTTALILAAGRGERLLPYTRNMPKAMLKVQGKPLLSHHIEQLAQCGFQRIIINHAYLGYNIRNYFGNGQHFHINIDYLPEPPGGLETGGTLATIAHYFHIQDSILLSINADIYTDYAFSRSKTLQTNHTAHLVLVPPSPQNPSQDFGLDDQHRICLHHQRWSYAGICYYQLAALKKLSIKRFSIRDWLKQQAQNKSLQGEIHLGKWIDIGTPQRYQMAQRL